MVLDQRLDIRRPKRLFARIRDTIVGSAPFALAKIPVISWNILYTIYQLVMVQRGAVDYILQGLDGHEFIPRSAISISYLANVSGCLANVLRHPSCSVLDRERSVANIFPWEQTLHARDFLPLPFLIVKTLLSSGRLPKQFSVDRQLPSATVFSHYRKRSSPWRVCFQFFTDERKHRIGRTYVAP